MVLNFANSSTTLIVKLIKTRVNSPRILLNGRLSSARQGRCQPSLGAGWHSGSAGDLCGAGTYSLNCAARHLTAAGTPSAATISRNFAPNSVLVAYSGPTTSSPA